MDFEQKAAIKTQSFIPFRPQSEKRVLVMTAVSAERDAVLRGLQGNSRFDVLVAGVGSVVAAVNTARTLTTAVYSLVISAGIGGGFPGRAEVGSLVVANKIVVADLGVETAEGFCSIEELGFGFNYLQPDLNLVGRLSESLRTAKIPINIGPVLTVSTVTGTAEGAVKLAVRVPGATAEAMEGYGVGFAAFEHGLPVLEIRAISNMVGPRNRATWRIKEALEVLEAASEVLTEVKM